MANPICPTDCTAALPVVNFNVCAPVIALSEIRRIFIARPSAEPLTDWELATEWITRISNEDVASNDAIRVLTVIADKPAPAVISTPISNGRTQVTGKDHTLNFTIDDVSAENYEFMRTVECGGKYRVWYETEGGFLYGGAAGILGEMTAYDVLNRGREEIETISGTITWRSKFSPERVQSPIFDSEFAEVESDPGV